MILTAIFTLIVARLWFGKRKTLRVLDGMIYKLVAKMPTWSFNILLLLEFKLKTKRNVYSNNRQPPWKQISSFRKRYAHHPSLEGKVIHLGKNSQGEHYALHCGKKPHYTKWDTEAVMDVIYYRKKLGTSFTPEMLEFSPPPLSSFLGDRLTFPALP